MTPRATVRLLQGLSRRPDYPVLRAGLPVLGVDGTLADVVSADSPARGKVHAKTGSLSHVSALSGYIERADGTWVAFSIVVNNFAGPAAGVHNVMDRICNLILE